MKPTNLSCYNKVPLAFSTSHTETCREEAVLSVLSPHQPLSFLTCLPSSDVSDPAHVACTIERGRQTEDLGRDILLASPGSAWVITGNSKVEQDTSP